MPHNFLTGTTCAILSPSREGFPQGMAQDSTAPVSTRGWALGLHNDIFWGVGQEFSPSGQEWYIYIVVFPDGYSNTEIKM